jgi:tripartite-type tricarboxylate transporter receptor subunit TctC
VIENRPGAAMIIGTEAAAKAAPDGYTLLVAHDGTMAMNGRGRSEGATR